MTKKEKIIFDEPKTFTIAKYRFFYSIIVLIVIVGTLIFQKEPPPPICIGSVALLAMYLFLPFTYKLIVSDEAISSINLLGIKTLKWNQVAEIALKNGNLLLNNRDGDMKVTVNQQIDDYPEVLKFIKQQRPELWKLDDIHTFHQNYLERAFSVFMGFVVLVMGIWAIMENGWTSEMIVPLLFIFSMSMFLIFYGLMRIRKLSLDEDKLVVTYLIWERQIHVSEVWSVSLEQQYGKNIITYPIHIRIRDKKDIVVEKVKEGNPILVNAIELWMERYKGKQSDRL